MPEHPSPRPVPVDWIGPSKFEDRIYVLHCFQKKAHKGRKTDRKDVELVQARLKIAEADYRRRGGRKRV